MMRSVVWEGYGTGLLFKAVSTWKVSPISQPTCLGKAFYSRAQRLVHMIPVLRNQLGGGQILSCVGTVRLGEGEY